MTQMIENSRIVQYIVAVEVTQGCVVSNFKSGKLQSQPAVNQYMQKMIERFPAAKVRGEVYLVTTETALTVHLSNEGWSKNE